MVARADDGRLCGDFSVLEGGTHVGAGAVQSVDLALVAKKKDGVPFYVYDSALGFRKLAVWKDLDPVHVVLLSWKNPVQRPALLGWPLDWVSQTCGVGYNSASGTGIILARPLGANQKR
jgi:hypothetical protein